MTSNVTNVRQARDACDNLMKEIKNIKKGLISSDKKEVMFSYCSTIALCNFWNNDGLLKEAVKIFKSLQETANKEGTDGVD